MLATLPLLIVLGAFLFGLRPVVLAIVWYGPDEAWLRWTRDGLVWANEAALAGRVARNIEGQFRRGTVAAKVDGDVDVGIVVLVPGAGVLGVTRQAEASTTESLVAALASQRMLLVLDNCEHVIDEAADVAADRPEAQQRLATLLALATGDADGVLVLSAAALVRHLK